MSKQLTVSEKVDQIAALADDQTASDIVYAKHKATLKDALRLSIVIKQVEDLMTDDVLEQFEHLQGKAVGFLTDRDDKGGYPLVKLKDPLVQAVVAGFLPLNNEINIISGRMMPVKNGLRRKILEYPGVTDLRLEPGQPKMSKGCATVPIKAEWKLDGKKCERKWDGILVRLNQGMGGDGAIGKAERKAMKAIWEQLMGVTTNFAEDDDVVEGEVMHAGDPDEAVKEEIRQKEMDESGLFPKHEQTT